MSGFISLLVLCAIILALLFGLNWLFGLEDKPKTEQDEEKVAVQTHRKRILLPYMQFNHLHEAIKTIVIIFALVIGYLWSGGVWAYTSHDRYMFKSNKITGTTYVLYDSEWQRIKHGGDLK